MLFIAVSPLLPVLPLLNRKLLPSSASPAPWSFDPFSTWPGFGLLLSMLPCPPVPEGPLAGLSESMSDDRLCHPLLEQQSAGKEEQHGPARPRPPTPRRRPATSGSSRPDFTHKQDRPSTQFSHSQFCCQKAERLWHFLEVGRQRQRCEWNS